MSATSALDRRPPNPRIERVRSFIRSSAVVLGLIVAPADAVAQSGNRGTMVMDDGETRRVLHYAEPDVRQVLQPDVILADLRLFEDELRLSPAQRDAVRRLIVEYLDSFAALDERGALANEPDPDAPARRRAEGGPAAGPGGAGPGPDDDERNAVRSMIRDELSKAGFDVSSADELPYSPSISVGVSMDDSGDGPEPAVDVSVSFGGEDDSMTDEVREKLQGVADRVVPRITEHVRAQIANQFADQSLDPMGGGGIDEKWRELEDLRDQIQALARARQALLRRLMTSVQTLLAEEQLALWPRFERTLTRVKTLPRGTLDGERTDLLGIIADLDLTADQRGRIEEQREAYELQLHEALRRRNELLEDIDGEIDRALYEGKGELALSLVDRLTRARVAVRDLAVAYADSIGAELDEAAPSALRGLVLAESHPQVYTTTIGGRAFAAVLALDDLPDDVRSAVEAMQRDYEVQIREVNDRIVRRTRKEQARELRASIERVIAITEMRDADVMDDGPDEIADAYRTRQQLDARTMTTLYSMLPPEQVAVLPAIPTVDLGEPVISEHLDPSGLP